MLISAPNGSEDVTFIPESKYDYYCIGRFKVLLEREGISCNIEYQHGTPEMKRLTFDRQKLIDLLMVKA